ncbi:MAG TPA: ABC transporter permease, partial [bacterium]|nr:ABC transporter permease [bacterium]
DPIRRHVNGVNPPKRMWRSLFGTMLAFEAEIATHMGLDAFTFFTPFDARTRSFTPVDTLDRMNIPNVSRQVETIFYLLSEMIKTRNVFPEAKFMVDDYGRDVWGKVYEFDRKKRFVPEDKIPSAFVTYRHSEDWMRHTRDVCGVKTDQILFSSIVDATPGLLKEEIEPGDFYIRNVVVVDETLNPKPGITFAGYVLGDDGEIVMMPDLGQDGARSYPLGTGTFFFLNKAMVMLFPCRTMTLYDIIDSRYLRALDVFDIKTGYDAEPIRYGKAEHPWQFYRPKDIEPIIVVAAEPDERIKILGSTGPYGVKYLLTNAPEELLTNPVPAADITNEIEEQSRGTGYPLTASLDHSAYKAARDMWIIDDIRIKSFSRYGIRNERLMRLHEQAREALLSAKAFLEQYRYDSFMSAVQRAWGLEARGYPDVKATMNDTVSGVLFYFAILVPFSVFMERLIFGFPDIRKRVAGFAFFLLLIFLILRKVHPAFKLSTSPYVIFLAFIIMMLAGVVLSIIVTKFGDEIRKMKASGTGVSDVDVGRLSAAKAAVFIGISNLRKRKVRTVITALTVTLLTFTVQSFTSVRSTMRFYKIPVSETPSYQGGLIRDLNWAPLQECTLDYLRGAFAHCARVIPRCFNSVRSQGQMEYFRVQNTETNKATLAFGLVGLTPEEIHAIDYPSAFVGKSRWFETATERSCILPDTMASLLGLSETDIGRASVNIMGQEFDLCGILDAQKYNSLRDLDDEKTTPLDTVAQMSEARQAADTSDVGKAALKLESFWHIDADNTVILPFDWVMDHGGVLESISVTAFRNPDGTPLENFIPIVEDFMLRIATTMFVGYQNSVKVYSSIGQTSFSGVGRLLVPIAIAAFIVLNTMMGSVHERRKEISVYSSVGLAPTHIGALFVAESAVFATVGAVLGYLLGQVVMRLLTDFGWLSGLELNYSSISAVYSTLIVMVVVFLSSLYPARLASSMAVPDVTRKWKFPDPVGDLWHFDFPFTVRGSDALAMCVYLAQYFRAYTESSLGSFFARDVGLTGTENDEPHYTIEMMIWLAPYDLGVSQRVRLEAFSTGEYGIYKIVITITRESGQVTTWRRMNRGFLNTLRKRCLVWRTITPAQRDKYREEGIRLVGSSAGVAE